MGLPALIEGVLTLINAQKLIAERALKPSKERFLMFIDHCFAIRGQGTVLTGTVVAGRVEVSDDIQLPDFQVSKKVKGIQVFHQPVPYANQGDRIGLCITQFDAKDLERGIACGSEAGVVHTALLVARVAKVKYHKNEVTPHHTYHISLGHSTVMGSMRFFSSDKSGEFNIEDEFAFHENLPDGSATEYAAPDPSGAAPGEPTAVLPKARVYYAVVQLERHATTVAGATIIASRLDADVHANVCRLAVEGVVAVTSLPHDDWRRIRAVRYRQKVLRIDRVLDAVSCIAKGLVRPKPGMDKKAAGAAMHSDVQKFLGLTVHYCSSVKSASDDIQVTCASLPSDAVPGRIESSFGKTGKVKLVFSAPVFREALGKKPEKDSAPEDDSCEGPGISLNGSVLLITKKYPFALHSSLQQ
jgi:selenocysteine-specific elongation factor